MTFVFAIETFSKDLSRKNQIMKMLFSIKEESGAPTTYYVVFKVHNKMNVPISRVIDPFCGSI
jgi:hypothetical protein